MFASAIASYVCTTLAYVYLLQGKFSYNAAGVA